MMSIDLVIERSLEVFKTKLIGRFVADTAVKVLFVHPAGKSVQLEDDFRLLQQLHALPPAFSILGHPIRYQVLDADHPHCAFAYTDLEGSSPVSRTVHQPAADDLDRRLGWRGSKPRVVCPGKIGRTKPKPTTASSNASCHGVTKSKSPGVNMPADMPAYIPAPLQTASRRVTKSRTSARRWSALAFSPLAT